MKKRGSYHRPFLEPVTAEKDGREPESDFPRLDRDAPQSQVRKPPSGGAKKGGLAEGGLVTWWNIGHFGVPGGPGLPRNPLKR